jgi:hypothetical protein
MVMHGYFHQQIRPFGSNINKQTHKLTKYMSAIFRGVILAEQKKPCGNAPQRRTGLVKLTISL